MTSYQVELKQTLYWTINVEVETDHEIDQVIDDVEEQMLPELEQHYTFADFEEREAKIVTVDGEKYTLVTRESLLEFFDESLDIMKWALKQNDPNSWISYNKRMQFDIIEENDNEFKYWLDRYKYFDRFPENNRDYYRAKCGEYLIKLNQLLECNQYLLTNKLLFVDVAIFPFIRQCANVDKYWFKDTYAKLANWLNNIIESKLFISVMDKYLEYNSSQRPLITNFS